MPFRTFKAGKDVGINVRVQTDEEMKSYYESDTQEYDDGDYFSKEDDIDQLFVHLLYE